MRALALVLVLLLAGCTGAAPLEKGERFLISCRRGDPGEVVVRVEALLDRYLEAPYLRGEVSLVEGTVLLEHRGWASRPEFEGQAKRVLEVKVGFEPGAPFRFVFLF